MYTPKVKICGITNLDDAKVAVDAGADFLGFIFYPPSPRSISIDKAQLLIANLRSNVELPLLVGVFVNEPPEKIAQVLDTCDLDLAQLSGDETPDFVGDRHSPIYGRCFKAIRPKSASEAVAEAGRYLPPQTKKDQPTLLVDTHHADLFGGTGQTADWSIAAHLAGQIPGIMLAGGLKPSNVARSVNHVRPFAVDVASGIESIPGRKDPDLVMEFIANAKSQM